MKSVVGCLEGEPSPGVDEGSRLAVEDLVVVNRPLGLLARLGGSRDTLEYRIVRVDLVVQDEVPGCDSQSLLHGKLVRLRVPGQEPVLGLVQLRLSDLHRIFRILYATWNA